MSTAVGRALSLTLLLLALPSAGWAEVVTCDAAAPLADHSDASLESALTGAIDACVRRATAMGLSWIRVDLVAVLDDRVIVRMVTGDETTGDEEEETDDEMSPSRDHELSSWPM